MQIRPIKPEELDRFAEIDRKAFVTNPAEHREWIEAEVQDRLDTTRALIDDKGEILTILQLIYPKLWLGARAIPTPGLQAVASPVENRRQGYIRHLLTSTLQEVHNDGYATAILYPFNFPFYKKFGFEQVSTSKSVALPLAALQKFRPKAGGRWKEVGPDRWLEFSQIYETICTGKFGNLTRDESWWKYHNFQQPKNKKNNLYLWYDQTGKPQAYVITSFKTDPQNGKPELQAERAWTSTAAYHEVLAFLANHDSQAARVSWYTALDDEIQPLIDNPREVEEKSRPGYMLRILDVQKALQERSWPAKASGSFSLAVRDDLFEWNNRILRLDFSGGLLTTETLLPESKADLTCDVRQLAQLYTGYLSPLKLAQYGLIEVSSADALNVAQELFSPPYQPASHMADFF